MKIKYFCIGLLLCSLLLNAFGTEKKNGGSTSLMPGSYVQSTNGEWVLDTNISAMWPGVWVSGTNGFRSELEFLDTNSIDPLFVVEVGSVVTNASSLYGHPDGKFSKLQLRNSRGELVTAKINLEAKCPSRINFSTMPKWHDGALRNAIGFRSNTPPAMILKARFHDVFQINSEGDYVLMACPVLYRCETNREYLDRVDLETVSASIHLKPR